MCRVPQTRRIAEHRQYAQSMHYSGDYYVRHCFLFAAQYHAYGIASLLCIILPMALRVRCTVFCPWHCKYVTQHLAHVNTAFCAAPICVYAAPRMRQIHIIAPMRAKCTPRSFTARRNMV